MKRKHLWALLFLLTAFSAMITGCIKKESYSIVPQISFLEFDKVYETGQYPINGILSISYQDGDGDIGLDPADSFPPYQRNGPYYYNLVLTLFEKQNGVFVQINDSIPFSARIPVLTPDDPGRAIKGYIVDTIPLYPPPPYDTLKFEVFLYDRALHKSNVISTPDIVLKRK